MKVKAAFLYADNGMVASTKLGWLHTAFEMLMELFDQVGLKTNLKKTVGMVCHPCWASKMVNKDYTWRMTRLRRIYRGRQRNQVNFPEFGKYLTRGPLSVHRQIKHILAKRGSGQESDEDSRGNKPRENSMAFP